MSARLNIPLAFLVITLLMGAPLPARENEPPETPPEKITEAEEMIVIAPGASGDAETLRQTLLERGADRNLAEVLGDLSGVSLMRQAASGAEPVIRGLGWERVQTVMGAVPLYGACPGRMDPPATYLNLSAAGRIRVLRNGGGLGLGPGGTGGAIHADPDYERPAGAPGGLKVFAESGYGSARNAFHADAGFQGGSDAVDVKLSLRLQNADDYHAADGARVPARLDSRGVNVSVGWRPDQNSRLWNAISRVHEKDVDFPALPMDNLETDFTVYNAGWRRDFHDGTLRRIDLTGGLSAVDHLMGNDYKVNRALMEANTDSKTRTYATHAHFHLRPGESLRLKTGLDFNRLTRDATRTRFIPASGATFLDRLWPDTAQQTIGGFADLRLTLSETTRLQLGGRLDLSDSKAGDPDAPSLGGKTVREQWVDFYGDEAGDPDRGETLGALSAMLQRNVGEHGSLYLRGGLSSRAAGVTERYFAYGPAPGGYQVGDPSLTAEKKLEGEIGWSRFGESVDVQVGIFRARVADYILPMVLAIRDVNGDGVDDRIKGFENIDATLTGGELGLTLRPTARLRIPLSLSHVRGRNTTADRDLPEIPALSIDCGADLMLLADSETRLSVGAHIAADQEKIDPLFPENRTDGYTVFRVGLVSRPVRGLILRASVENLFDELYHDHLTRNALLPSGDLAAGQDVPAPGRSVVVSMRWGF